MLFDIRKQNEIKDQCLKERLDLIVPQFIDEDEAWIVAAREYNEDLVFDLLTPSSYLNARRVTMLVFFKDKRFSLSMPDHDLEQYYTPYFKFGKEEQMEALNRLLNEYDPKKIAINISKNHTFADGLSHGLLEMFFEKMDKKYADRLYVNELLPIKVMELRTPTEMEIYPTIMKEAFDIIERTFSLDTIEVGKTTCEDLEYFMMNEVKKKGLVYWFSPTIDKQSECSDSSRSGGVINEGDLLHCDFGITYLNCCTDTQRNAYIAKKDENTLPEWVANGFKLNNNFQDIVRHEMKVGRTGNEVLKSALEKGNQQSYKPCLYTHPCNCYGHGPGPIIGLWNNQNTIPILGEIPLSNNTTFALELNISYEYNGKTYTIFSEETVLLKDDEVTFLYPNRDQVYFLK